MRPGESSPERAARAGEGPLRLEGYALRHLPAWLALVNDPDVRRGVNRVYPVGLRRALGEWLEGTRDRRQGKALRFAVLSGRTFVGACGLTGMSPLHAEGWVNYWIGRDYWRRGYATAALRLLLATARDDLKLQVLYARCLTDNAASQAVLRSCGFARIGHQGFTERASGRQAGTLIYGLQL